LRSPTAARPFARVGALATAVALAGCGSSAAKAVVPVPFTSVEGRYSVEFPKQPDTGVREAGDAGLKRRVTSTMASKGGDDYGVTWSDFPADYLASGPTAVLEKVRDTVIADVKATLVSSDEITLSGHPGLAVKAKVASGATKGDYRVRFFLVKNRVYEVLVIRNNPGAPEQLVQDFFDSFTLTGS